MYMGAVGVVLLSLIGIGGVSAWFKAVSGQYVIAGKCLSCTYIDQGFFIKTNAAGTITVKFQCNTDAVTSSFCNNPTLPSFTAAVGDQATSCAALRTQTVSYEPEDSVTVWGDDKTDPSFITVTTNPVPANVLNGDHRDWWPEDFETLAQGALITPTTVARHPRMGAPNIYAATGFGIWSYLASFRGPSIPLAGNVSLYPTPARTLEADLAPPYLNNNKKLLLYVGTYDAARLSTFILDTTFNSMPTAHRRLYQYLTTHENVVSSEAFSSWVGELEPRDHTAAEVAALVTILDTAYGCGTEKGCFTKIVGVVGTVPVAKTVTFSSQFFLNEKARGSTMEFSRLKVPGAAVDVVLGAAASPTAVLVTYTYPTRNGAMANYPFGLFPTGTSIMASTYGFLIFAEQSVDGKSWNLVEESLHPNMVALYNRNDFAGMLAAARGGTHLCINAATVHYCWVPYGVTGKNRYIRTVTITSRTATMTSAAVTSQGNPGLVVTVPPAALLTAEKIGVVDLFVTDSTHATLNAPLLMGYSQCLEVPNCHYIPSTYGNTYPADFVTALKGSPTVRNFMKNEVMPRIFPNKLIKNPVQTFLAAPNGTVATCLRLKSRPNKMTCYNSAVSTYVGTSPQVIKSAASTLYQKGGFELAVTVMPDLGFISPEFVLGSFTPENTIPDLYVYQTAVPTSYEWKGLHVSTTEQCAAGTSLGMMTTDPTCTCSPHKLPGMSCLCVGFSTFKPLPAPTEPATFKVPTPEVSYYNIPLTHKFIITSSAVDLAQPYTVNVDVRMAVCGDDQLCLRNTMVAANGGSKVDSMETSIRLISDLRARRVREAQTAAWNFMARFGATTSDPAALVSGGTETPYTTKLKAFFGLQFSAAVPLTPRVRGGTIVQLPDTFGPNAFALTPVTSGGSEVLISATGGLPTDATAVTASLSAAQADASTLVTLSDETYWRLTTIKGNRIGDATDNMQNIITTIADLQSVTNARMMEMSNFIAAIKEATTPDPLTTTSLKLVNTVAVISKVSVAPETSVKVYGVSSLCHNNYQITTRPGLIFVYTAAGTIKVSSIKLYGPTDPTSQHVTVAAGCPANIMTVTTFVNVVPAAGGVSQAGSYAPASLSGDVTALTTTVGTVQTDLNTLIARVTADEVAATAAVASVNAIRTDLTALEARVTADEAAAAGITVGPGGAAVVVVSGAYAPATLTGTVNLLKMNITDLETATSLSRAEASAAKTLAAEATAAVAAATAAAAVASADAERALIAAGLGGRGTVPPPTIPAKDLTPLALGAAGLAIAILSMAMAVFMFVSTRSAISDYTSNPPLLSRAAAPYHDNVSDY